MAGHSKFKNIMHRKGAQDKKRANLFARLGREVQVAAQKGSDPQHNAHLRMAIMAARAENMPKDNIERAIARGSGQSDAHRLEHIIYEGYGPAGLAIIVECLTDNRKRTAAQVRTCFSKAGGTLAESNSVLFQFTRQGEIVFTGQDQRNNEALLELAVTVGADDIVWDEDHLIFITAPDNLHNIARNLEHHLPTPLRCRLIWKEQNTVELQGTPAESAAKLLNALEDLEDVQEVYSNLALSDSELERIAEA